MLANSASSVRRWFGMLVLGRLQNCVASYSTTRNRRWPLILTLRSQGMTGPFHPCRRASLMLLNARKPAIRCAHVGKSAAVTWISYPHSERHFHPSADLRSYIFQKNGPHGISSSSKKHPFSAASSIQSLTC